MTTPVPLPGLQAEAVLESGNTLELWRHARGVWTLLEFHDDALVWHHLFNADEGDRARAAYLGRVKYDGHDGGN